MGWKHYVYGSPLGFLLYFQKYVEYWTRSVGAHLQLKFRKKRIGKRMAIVFYSILGAVAEEAYFFTCRSHKWRSKVVNNIQNTEKNAIRPKKFTEFTSKNIKRHLDWVYPDCGQSPLLSKGPAWDVQPISPYEVLTQKATGTVTHWSCPFTLLPITCIPTDVDVAAPSGMLGDRQHFIKFPYEEGINYHGQLVSLLLATAWEHPL